MNKFKVFLCIIGLIIVSTAKAEGSGHELLRNCAAALEISNNPPSSRADLEYIYAARCIGYVKGIQDLNVIYQYSLDGKNFSRGLFCFPNGEQVSVKDGIQLIVNYLQQHPADLKQSDSILALKAFVIKYPCKHNSP